MMTHRRLFLLILFFLVPVWATAQVAEPPMKVLFIGNSYTYVNDLPSLVVGFADAAGGRKIETDQRLPGGYTFQQHVKGSKAIEKIRERKWDVVVLQGHSLETILNREAMQQYARILDAEIKKQGAKTIFYLTWARQNIPQMQDGADPVTSPDYARAMYQMSGAKKVGLEQWCGQHKAGLVGGIDGAYFDIADELNATVAPVGMAWKKALSADPKLVLHQPDKSHPNPTGSYLAACVFYATLFDKSPVGLPAELKKGNRVLVQVAPDEAVALQKIAWQTVQEMKNRHEAKAASVDGSFTPLFDGKTFTGLEGNQSVFRIEDGAVVGGSLKANVVRNEYLCTTKTYRNFELRLKFKLLGEDVNGGVQFRSERVPKSNEMIGYQADMGQTYWGCLYDERRHKLLTGPTKEEQKKLIWRRAEKRCQSRAGSGPRGGLDEML